MNKDLTLNISNDRFAGHCGIKLTVIREGYAEAELEIGDEHLNGAGSVHGGAIFTLADYAFAAASNSYGFVTVGINVSISYFKAPSGTKLKAAAREICTRSRICGYDVDVTDADGSLCARFAGLGYIKRN